MSAPCFAACFGELGHATACRRCRRRRCAAVHRPAPPSPRPALPMLGRRSRRDRQHDLALADQQPMISRLSDAWHVTPFESDVMPRPASGLSSRATRAASLTDAQPDRTNRRARLAAAADAANPFGTCAAAPALRNLARLIRTDIPAPAALPAAPPSADGALLASKVFAIRGSTPAASAKAINASSLIDEHPDTRLWSGAAVLPPPTGLPAVSGIANSRRPDGDRHARHGTAPRLTGNAQNARMPQTPAGQSPRHFQTIGHRPLRVCSR